MKKYIFLLFTIFLTFVAFRLNWYFSGNEAIAATQQVKIGDEYAIGRATQNMWELTGNYIKIIAGVLWVYTGYLFLNLKNKYEK